MRGHILGLYGWFMQFIDLLQNRQITIWKWEEVINMKKSLILKIVGIFMIIVSIRGVIFVFTDKEFDYAGIPMPFIYVMLCAFVLITLYVLWLGFIKKK